MGEKSFLFQYSDPVDSALHYPDNPTCFTWAAVYHNISTVIENLDIEIYRPMGDWTDENN
jgi:hypothetical protein